MKSQMFLLLVLVFASFGFSAELLVPDEYGIIEVATDAAARWLTLGGDFQRSGLSKDPGPIDGEVKWRFETGGAVLTSITIGVDEMIHIGCSDGKIYTVNSEGVEQWQVDTGSEVLSACSVGPDGTIYAGCRDGKLYAINKYGEVLWTHRSEGMIYSTAAVAQDGEDEDCGDGVEGGYLHRHRTGNAYEHGHQQGGKVFVGSQDGKVCGLGSDGSELWEFGLEMVGEVRNAVLSSITIGIDGSVYVGSMYGAKLYALEPETGELEWECDFAHLSDPGDPESEMIEGHMFVSPVVGSDGVIYVTLLYDTNLYAVNPADGSILWETDVFGALYDEFDEEVVDEYRGSYCWSEPVLGPDGTIYVSYDDPFVRAVDMDGDIKWIKSFGEIGGFTLTVSKDGLVYLAGEDGSLRAVDGDGELLWQFDSGGELSYPVIGADKTIYVSDSGGGLWAICDNGDAVDSVQAVQAEIVMKEGK